MRKLLQSDRRHRDRRGTVLAILAFLIPALLAVSAYAINVVYMEYVRTELQIATDVTSRAAGRALAITGDQTKAFEAAQRLADENLVAGKVLELSMGDLEFGVSTRFSDTERYSFAAGKNPNAVHLRTESFVGGANNAIPMLFPTMGATINFRPIKSAICTQVELDIALVMDRSGSMAYASDEIADGSTPSSAPLGWSFGDPAPPMSRWNEAVAALHGFIDVLEKSAHDERVSLSTYSSKSTTDQKLTNDYSLVKTALQKYSDKFDDGSTSIGDGILEGAAALSDKKVARPWAARVMIVLSDGIYNSGIDPIIAANMAAGEEVMIFTVSFSAEADQAKMLEIAECGAGKHYYAGNSGALAEAFEDIARSLPTLITY